MENRLKLRLPRLFRSSLSSCHPRNSTDIAENPNCLNGSSSFRRLHAVSPTMRLFPSMCKPETPRRSRVTDDHSTSLFFSAQDKSSCFPASPGNPPMTSFSKSSKRRTKKQRSKKRSTISSDYLFSSLPLDESGRFKSSGSWCWSSSDEEEDETDTLFSSRSFSSDSSTSRRKNRTTATEEIDFSILAVENLKDDRETSMFRQNKKESRFSPLIVNNEKDATFEKKSIGAAESGEIRSEREEDINTANPLKDSFAVVKRSTDPYDDFRTSMVEMIVERQIFAAAELEELLRCFLSLNSDRHHQIIVEVFLEIYEALFTT